MFDDANSHIADMKSLVKESADVPQRKEGNELRARSQPPLHGSLLTMTVEPCADEIGTGVDMRRCSANRREVGPLRNEPDVPCIYLQLVIRGAIDRCASRLC